MNPTIEIFSQGEEVVTGQVTDTNAAWLSQHLVEMGFSVTRHTAVGDKLADLKALLIEISLRAEGCLCTGGLGPTSDDLTAQAVAEAFGLPLEFDETAFDNIQHFFQRRGLSMPEINRKQAFFPKGAMRIDNDFGTAPGFCLLQNNCWFVFLPGVPYEMQQLFIQHVKADLASRFTLTPQRLITLKTWGMGESHLQQQTNQVSLPETVQLGFRATLEENQVKLLFPHDYPATEINSIVSQLLEKIGTAVFAVDGLYERAGDMVSVVSQSLTAQKQTVALLETASCGLLAAKCIGQPWLIEASYQQKFNALAQTQTASQLINTALHLGRALQRSSCAEFALVQLYSGNPAAFADSQQSLTLYNVLTTARGFCQHTQIITGTLQRKQHQAAFSALDLLRRFLQHTESLCPYYD